MSNEKKPVIGITIGDLNGIGPEVIIKCFSDPRMLDMCTPVLYGNTSALNYHRKALDSRNFNFSQINSIAEARVKRFNLLNAWQDNVRITIGEPSEETGHYAMISLQAMMEDALDGKLDGIVTAPINKNTVHSEAFPFKGHTTWLAESMDARSFLMFMVSDDIKIGLVTDHVPIEQVSANLSIETILDKIRLMHYSLVIDFNIRKPKIAVLGLNPHAGEDGLLGDEEITIIRPAIELAKEEDIMAIGPYAADGFFGTHQYHAFDGILAMYHDQGLAPFKLLNFEKGVNYTAGLRVPRTSPDHGTAYAIAGKGIANEQSFRESIYTLCDIIAHRRLYDEVNENPLQNQILKEKEV